MSDDALRSPERRLISDGAPRNRAIVVFSETGKCTRAGWHPIEHYWMDRGGSGGGLSERLPFKVVFRRELTSAEKQDHIEGRPFSDRAR